MFRGFRVMFVLLLALGGVPPFAQSQAANGTIEGTVTDAVGRGAARRHASPSPTLDTGDTARRRHATKRASIARRCCRSAATACRPSCRASRSSSSRGIDAVGRPDRRRST